jgi:hypothetical protein
MDLSKPDVHTLHTLPLPYREGGGVCAQFVQVCAEVCAEVCAGHSHTSLWSAFEGNFQ